MKLSFPGGVVYGYSGTASRVGDTHGMRVVDGPLSTPEAVMAEGQTHRGGSSTDTTRFRPTAEERRAARAAAVAGRQGELKAEAAARRAKRAQQEKTSGPVTPDAG